MIKIGINQGIFIAAAAYEPATDKSNARLRITFEENAGVKYANAFDRMNADEAVESLPTRDIVIFAPSKPLEKDGRGNARTQEQKVNMINLDLTSTKAILLHLLGGYMTAKDAVLKLYDGIAIDGSNYNDQIIKEPIYQAVFKNMADQFIAKLKAANVFGATDKLFRLLLVRQDAANAFPTFRKRHVTENPFWEPMEIDEKASQVHFTEYEIQSGLNSDLPVKKSQADKPADQSGGGQAPLTAAGVFG